MAVRCIPAGATRVMHRRTTRACLVRTRELPSTCHLAVRRALLTTARRLCSIRYITDISLDRTAGFCRSLSQLLFSDDLTDLPTPIPVLGWYKTGTSIRSHNLNSRLWNLFPIIQLFPDADTSGISVNRFFHLTDCRYYY